MLTLVKMVGRLFPAASLVARKTASDRPEPKTTKRPTAAGSAGSSLTFRQHLNAGLSGGGRR